MEKTHKKARKKPHLDSLIVDKIKRKSDGRCYVHLGAGLQKKLRLKTDMVMAPSREILIEKLKQLLLGEHSHTVEQAFGEYQRYRYEINTPEKTIWENRNDWRSFIEGSKLSGKPLVSVTAHDINDFFDTITCERKLTSKRFINIKSLLNGIFALYVDRGIIEVNPVENSKSTSSYRKRFRQTPPPSTYSDEDIARIINYTYYSDDVYEVAVCLFMFLFIRISEFIALKYCDLEPNGYLWIRRTTRRYRETYVDKSGNIRFGKICYSTEERMKGNKETGYRLIPLPGEAVHLIERWHDHHPDDEYLFMFQGRQISSSTFNTRLKNICSDLSIKYRPSHQVRFTNATRLYKAGVPVDELSVLMGHGDIATTLHYVRRNNASDSTNNLTRSILSVTIKH